MSISDIVLLMFLGTTVYMFPLAGSVDASHFVKRLMTSASLYYIMISIITKHLCIPTSRFRGTDVAPQIPTVTVPPPPPPCTVCTETM